MYVLVPNALYSGNHVSPLGQPTKQLSTFNGPDSV